MMTMKKVKMQMLKVLNHTNFFVLDCFHEFFCCFFFYFNIEGTVFYRIEKKSREENLVKYM